MTVNDEDVSLIAEIGRENEAALAQLMARYKEPVFHFIYRYLANPADSAEVVEETFFRVYQKAGHYTPRAAVKTWIFSIARNLAVDRLRRQKKLRGQVSLETSDAPEESVYAPIHQIDSGVADPSNQLKSREALRQIDARIRELPEKLRFPFIFCVLEDHAYDECAAILRTNRKTVETRIYRARKQLREALAGFLQNT
ncbi:RNA polymerase sigma factor [Coraliomargarita parva]|uniref:RNA polymerase sigma factor n=1 Tax=Coraliomargarita parva TaxID=3014050 RepID=UPI0022B4E6BF|nr:sigma-70 family RNA polymerase sigma factor [Coraliomargarita parva]